MKIAVRRKHTFVDLQVDEIETIIFQSDSSEIDDTIENLQEVIKELTKLKQQEQCKCGKPKVGGYSCQRTDCNQTFKQQEQ